METKKIEIDYYDLIETGAYSNILDYAQEHDLLPENPVIVSITPGTDKQCIIIEYYGGF